MPEWRLQIIGIISLLVLTLAPIPAKAAKGQDEGIAAASGQPTVKSQSAQDNYLVGAGDILNIVVWKNEDLSGEYLVRPDGKITLPLIGDVVASGMSTDAIAMQIAKKIELFIEDPFITVIVIDAASNKIYVLGEVAQPGVYQLQDQLSVLQALALAGGFTEFAKTDEMVVIRRIKDKQTRYRVSYKEILKAPEKGHNLLLKRGDTLVVP